MLRFRLNFRLLKKIVYFKNKCLGADRLRPTIYGNLLMCLNEIQTAPLPSPHVDVIAASMLLPLVSQLGQVDNKHDANLLSILPLDYFDSTHKMRQLQSVNIPNSQNNR